MTEAPQNYTKKSAAAKNGAVSFEPELEDGELLTGTPTATSVPEGLTIDNVRVSTGELTINEKAVPTGRAVQFRVAGGVARKQYKIRVTCATNSSPAQTLVVDCPLAVSDA
jgi:hypothetical protein